MSEKPKPPPKKRVDKSTGESSAVPVGALVPQPHGGALRNGGTNKGGTGRPPDAWKAKMRELADRWAQAAEANRVLDDPDHKEWMAAGRFVGEQAHGKADAKTTIAGDADHPLVIAVVVRRED